MPLEMRSRWNSARVWFLSRFGRRSGILQGRGALFGAAGKVGQGERWALALRARGTVFLACFCLSCGPAVAVKVAYDPAANFAAYRTFAMAEPNRAVRTAPDANPFIEQRLRQLTFEQLHAHGLVPKDKAEADLVVYVVMGSRERVDVYYDAYYGRPYPGAYGYRGAGWGAGTTSAVVVEEGLIVIDLVDRRKNAVLWRGTGNIGAVKDLSDDELRYGVQQVLATYPPGARGGQP